MFRSIPSFDTWHISRNHAKAWTVAPATHPRAGLRLRGCHCARRATNRANPTFELRSSSSCVLVFDVKWFRCWMALLSQMKRMKMDDIYFSSQTTNRERERRVLLPGAYGGLKDIFSLNTFITWYKRSSPNHPNHSWNCGPCELNPWHNIHNHLQNWWNKPVVRCHQYGSPICSITTSFFFEGFPVFSHVWSRRRATMLIQIN